MSGMLLGQTWYPRLISKGDGSSSLEDRYEESALRDMFVVCYNIRGRLYYSAFNNYLRFYSYQSRIKDEERSFFEVIPGLKSQKPKFDIDGLRDDVDHELLLSKLVEVCQVQVEKYKPGTSLSLERDILIYESLSPTKRTYHLVLNNYHHENNEQAKIFYQEVMSMLEEYKEFIDPGVYSSRQQFRIVGSQKPNSGRPKIFLEKWSYFGKEIVHDYGVEIESPEHKGAVILGESLITVVSNSTLLCHPTLECPSKKRREESEFEDVSPELAIRALQLYASRGDMNIRDRRFPYKISSIEGGLVILKRTRASRCPICERVHTSENPYLLVVNEEVYFYCRRSNDNLYVGTLHLPVEVPIEEEKEKTLMRRDNDVKIRSLTLNPVIPVKRVRPVSFQIPEWNGSVIDSLDLK